MNVRVMSELLNRKTQESTYPIGCLMMDYIDSLEGLVALIVSFNFK